MIIEAWRIVKSKYGAIAFTGEGASLVGGRWNSIGIPIVYTSSSAALAVLEILVNVESTVPLPSYCLYRIIFKDDLIETLTISRLPRNWRGCPPPPDTQHIGDIWIAEARSAILAVPSAVLPYGMNYLLNPSHPSFSQVEIGPQLDLGLDPRIKILPSSD